MSHFFQKLLDLIFKAHKLFPRWWNCITRYFFLCHSIIKTMTCAVVETALLSKVIGNVMGVVSLTFSWQRPSSYRNQSIDLRSKSMDWFLYDNGLRHERVKVLKWIGYFMPRHIKDPVKRHFGAFFAKIVKAP